MAQQIQIAGSGATARVRSPVAVAIFSVITLGIYLIFWWYYVNREMVDYGRALGTSELGDSPGKSTLALFPGGLVIVPAIWTTVTTFQRVQASQRFSGQMPINGWLGVVLYIVDLAGDVRLHAERAQQRLEDARRRRFGTAGSGLGSG